MINDPTTPDPTGSITAAQRPAVEYETEYEPLITCPYCGHKDNDSWECAGQFDGDERTINCGYCEHSFKMTTHIELTFSTEKIEP